MKKKFTRGFWNGPSSASFSFIFNLKNKTNCSANLCEKIFIQSPVMGLEPLTSLASVFSYNHLTRAPVLKLSTCSFDHSTYGVRRAESKILFNFCECTNCVKSVKSCWTVASVTRWVDYFSIFGHLENKKLPNSKKLAKSHFKFSQILNPKN